MSLAYIDHQRTRFWRTHEQIFDFRRTRDTNWLDLTTSRQSRDDQRKQTRENRRNKWEEERREREKADEEFRLKREAEREGRREKRKQEDDAYAKKVLSGNSSAENSSSWERHVDQRKALRDRQAERLEENKKFIDKDYDSIQKRKADILLRQDLRARSHAE